jgi:hypothetical protein
VQWNRIQEGWEHLAIRVRARWDRLDPQDVSAIDGDRDSLLDRLCERYEMPRKDAEWQVSAWQNAYSDRWLYDLSDSPR